MIGQFGVGFYSSFLVSDRVVVISSFMNSNETYRWESSADGTFAVNSVDENFGRGTKVICYLKKEEQSFLD